jgi:hypothetical protein
MKIFVLLNESSDFMEVHGSLWIVYSRSRSAKMVENYVEMIQLCNCNMWPLNLHHFKPNLNAFATVDLTQFKLSFLCIK